MLILTDFLVNFEDLIKETEYEEILLSIDGSKEVAWFHKESGELYFSLMWWKDGRNASRFAHRHGWTSFNYRGKAIRLCPVKKKY